jgi:hypothetical protein
LFFKQQETLSIIGDYNVNIGGDVPPEFDDPLM